MLKGRGATTAEAQGGLTLLEERSKWVNVSWLPHPSLGQTSHAAVAIRSILTSLDQLKCYTPEEWQVRATVNGVAGQPIVPISCLTEAKPVMTLNDHSAIDGHPPIEYLEEEWFPMTSSATHICKFDVILYLPIRWRDLPRDAYIKFEILSHEREILYIGITPLFNAYGKLQSGLMRVPLESPESDCETRRNAGLLPPPKVHDPSEWQETDQVWKASRMLHQLDRFDEAKTNPTTQSSVHREFGAIQPVPWLDTMLKEYCYSVLNEAKSSSNRNLAFGEPGSSGYLVIELPTFDVPVMYEETFYPVPQNGPAGNVTPLDLALHRRKTIGGSDAAPFHTLQAVPFLDYEDENNNPVEDKYRTLAHDLLRGLVDPALKPDRVQRDQLAAIIASPSHHLSTEEKDLLWRFRFSLVDNRRALTKFLLAVDWTVESEVVQAAELLEQWRKRSPIEVTDALKLLGKQVAYQTNLVRTYAIDTLATAPDEELTLYLLQLVQALKFENIQDTGVSHSVPHTGNGSSLAAFLIARASKNIQLANYLYWYLKVEMQDPTHGARYQEVFAELEGRLSQTTFESLSATPRLVQKSSQSAQDTNSEVIAAPFKSIVDSAKKIGSTLRGNEAPQKSVEITGSEEVNKTVWDILREQDQFLSGIMEAQRLYGSKSKKDAKETYLRSALATGGFDKSSKRDIFPLPCAPEVFINGVNPQTAKVFKSAVYPALVEFHVISVTDKTDFGESRDGSEEVSPSAISHTQYHQQSYRAMIKTGDDLRQDQLVIMMIKLMDGLLKRASLDMCLTPYSIIATSPSSGMIEFVEKSQPLSQILAGNNNSILQFLQSSAPQKGAKHNVRPDAMANYVRSCAGYCVITYLLGVGDRHLDNLMVTQNGNFFHIDFGFMFGRDPKPLPPAFRLTREMVEGMGGLESAEYRQFCSLACQAFNVLRKSAGLVLNLLHLMSDAGIEDLSNNPSADSDGVIAKVEERFKLELTDEQAERFFLNLIGDCLSALAPRLMDVFHSIAVARR